MDASHSEALAQGAVHCTGSGLRLRLGSRRVGSGAGEDSVSLTLLRVESRRASAWRSGFWRRDSLSNWRRVLMSTLRAAGGVMGALRASTGAAGRLGVLVGL